MTTYSRLFDASDEQWDEMLNAGNGWKVVEEEIEYVDDHGEKTTRVVFHRLADDTYWEGFYSFHPEYGTIYYASMCEVEPHVVIRTEFRKKVHDGEASD